MNEISNGAWSETDASNNAATPNGWPEGQPPSSVNDCARMMMGAVKRFWGRINGTYVTTGAANAYVLTPAAGLSAYVAGERYSFRASFANSGPATLDISSLGAKTIKRFVNGGSTASALVGGEIQDGQPVTVEYDGTDLIMVTPAASETDLTLVSTDAGALAGPTLTIDRSSTSPAASDVLGNIAFSGRDSGGEADTYARIAAGIIDATASSEDGEMFLQAVVAGTLTTVAKIGNGVQLGTPAGGYKGAGTLNALAVYDDNVLLTDYVFDILLDGAVRPEEADYAVRFDPRFLDPTEFAAFWHDNRHLPAMPSREDWRNGTLPVGALVQRLWETVEVQAIHIEKLNVRLKAIGG
jgi:hypothetical protein